MCVFLGKGKGVCVCGVCVCVCVCVFLIKFNHLYLAGCVFFGKGKGGEHPICTDTRSYKDLNLKILTSEWDSNPRPHEY